MAVTAEVAAQQMAAQQPTPVNEVPPEFTFAANFSILTFPGGGHLLQQQGSGWAKAFTSIDDMVDFLVKTKRDLYAEKGRVHSDHEEFPLSESERRHDGLGEASPHDFIEPMVTRRDRIR